MNGLSGFIKRIRNESRKGTGEILGFILVVPALLIILCMTLTVGELTIYKQKLTYMAYSMGRAAVVSSGPDIAKSRAEGVMEAAYGDSFAGVLGVEDPGRIESMIGTLGDYDVCGQLAYHPDGTTKWEKGTLIVCMVCQRTKPLIPFVSDIRKESIVMMIENAPALKEEDIN